MRQKILVLLIMILALACSACSASNVVPISGGNYAEIEWVDFVVQNDIHYSRDYNGNNTLSGDKIDEIIGEVKFNVSENIHSTEYKIKNGDAAFLQKGTKIHKIKGYKPEFRIAVNYNGEWRIYEADSNPGAKKGEDLLDIRDKVLYIGINSETDGKTELGAIKEKAVVDKLIDMVSNAKVGKSNSENAGQRYFVSFHLLDGTEVTRCYWIGSGELSRGIMLPGEFGAEIKKALANKG